MIFPIGIYFYVFHEPWTDWSDGVKFYDSSIQSVENYFNRMDLTNLDSEIDFHELKPSAIQEFQVDIMAEYKQKRFLASPHHHLHAFFLYFAALSQGLFTEVLSPK